MVWCNSIVYLKRLKKSTIQILTPPIFFTCTVCVWGGSISTRHARGESENLDQDARSVFWPESFDLNFESDSRKF